ncbi:MAG: DUF3102 domain-containing protein [bacterium]
MEKTVEINLSQEINQAYEESLAFADEVKGRVFDAVNKAVECGQLLCRQKQHLKHGSWLEWLKINCPKVSQETARRYMRLANQSHVTDLKDVSNLRQAYIATGVLPLPDKKSKEPDAQTPWVKFTRHLDGFRLWFNNRVDEAPMETWPEDARRVLKNELKWFADLYEKL